MRISTIIPSYNRADLIGETLRSVLSQTRPPAEVIVVDDGSSDGTPDLVTEQFGKDVTLIRQQNAGAGPARNAGFARSTGDIIHFMDSDDLSSLNTYEVQAAAIEAGADFVYGPWLKTRFAGTMLRPEARVLQQHPVPARYRLDHATLLLRWVIVFQPCLFRRTLIEAAGPYRTDLKPSEDTELLYRIMLQAPAMAHTADTLMLYRVHPENQVSEQNLARRAIDHANLTLIMQRHADAGRPLGVLDRMLLRSNEARAARDVGAHAPDLATALRRHFSAVDEMLFPLRKLADRVRGKVRRELTGKSYGTIFMEDVLTEHQRALIAGLGYTIGSH